MKQANDRWKGRTASVDNFRVDDGTWSDVSRTLIDVSRTLIDERSDMMRFYRQDESELRERTRSGSDFTGVGRHEQTDNRTNLGLPRDEGVQDLGNPCQLLLVGLSNLLHE